MKRILISETPKYIGKKVKICGWVNSRRDHGKIIFVDLRDISGIVQLVISPQNENIYKTAHSLRNEWVICCEGEVKQRPKGASNPKIETGKIEIEIEKLEVLSQAKTLPFSIDDDGYKISEEKRMKYRYLDLRRERLQRNLKIRQKVIRFMREFLFKKGFIEIETPILTKSTPEGARDFLVPSRLYPGKFYALPQSPQQYKQMLMVAGFEKYFQIAKCLRDEDPRADRQPEHTQLDIEMSFVEQEEILALIEELFINLVKEIFPEKNITQIPFPRLTYHQAMEKYKTDRPDLRENKNKDNELAFCFIVDFPMFEWHKDLKKWGAMHHPFTQPKIPQEKFSNINLFIKEMKKNPQNVLAHQYDIVLNGFEIGGGSIRITNLELLTAVFEVLGHSKKEIRENFKHYFEAFSYGVPPHGGIALGVDRILAILLNEKTIREVIAFPKTGDNRDLMMDVPSKVKENQLKELHIKIIKKDDEDR